MLDYGCGSGVLAIAAKKLGAGAVVGVDIDPRALQASRDNATANAVEIQVVGPDAVPPGPYDVVVANILSNPLRLLAPLLAGFTRPGGQVVLAGILDQQAAAVAAAYAAVVRRAGRLGEGRLDLPRRRAKTIALLRSHVRCTMSMFTRCPHCDTVFRVTPQQLQVSSGQVRCGRCQEVFDAFSTLTSRLPGGGWKSGGRRGTARAADPRERHEPPCRR